MEQYSISVDGRAFPVVRVHTLVIGSGAASLNAADRLHQFGVTDLAIVTEDLDGGTSRNTGSDKQTYYKLAVASETPDSPYEMAEALYSGGSMHGDIALVEAMESLEAFYHLLSIGVPFPANRYGGIVGYKTDHDPKQRGTSIGPYTSRVMVECLLSEVKRRGIPIFDKHLVVKLLVDKGRTFGAIAMDTRALQDGKYGLVLFIAENTVFGVGGPGGLYHSSVYPAVHTGAIGLALEAGAEAVNLTESQYGLASTKFRWNVSGTYQQVIPRYISTNADGSDPHEFLRPYFQSLGEMCSAVFLKGYQWPFDPRKIENRGSSLIDILVYRETVLKGRRVYLDYRTNPGEPLMGYPIWGSEQSSAEQYAGSITPAGSAGKSGIPSGSGGSIGSRDPEVGRGAGSGPEPFRFEDLSEEAYTYLKKSEALFGRPIDRLKKMNPLAIELYRTHGIDLEREPLEIAVCAQHNNGGLAADLWWESTNIDRLFPVGEVNGTHGVYRPGGSALNSGQVGAIRAARKIAEVYRETELRKEEWIPLAEVSVKEMLALIERIFPQVDGRVKEGTFGGRGGGVWREQDSGRSHDTGQSRYSWQGQDSWREQDSWQEKGLWQYREDFQRRMTESGAHIRGLEQVKAAVRDALKQVEKFSTVKVRHLDELPVALTNRHLVFAHAAYLSAIQAYLEAGGGSRGSYLVMDPAGKEVHPLLEPEWKYKPEVTDFRERILVTRWDGVCFQHLFIPRRPIPREEYWFETTWKDHREKKFFKERGKR